MRNILQAVKAWLNAQRKARRLQRQCRELRQQLKTAEMALTVAVERGEALYCQLTSASTLERLVASESFRELLSEEAKGALAQELLVRLGVLPGETE